jgi:hypothetical protein
LPDIGKRREEKRRGWRFQTEKRAEQMEYSVSFGLQLADTNEAHRGRKWGGKEKREEEKGRRK